MVRRARKIIWTKNATLSKKELFLYWNFRNKSNTYSKKLNIFFKEALQMVSKYPESSIATQFDTLRLKLVRDYQLIYEITETEIIVHHVWDTRQNPVNFPIK
jgi:toxin YoeB